MTNTNRSIVPDEENPIGAIFTQFPELNGRQIARAMNINETLFQNYINGRKRPSFERLRDIENYLHSSAKHYRRCGFKRIYSPLPRVLKTIPTKKGAVSAK